MATVGNDVTIYVDPVKGNDKNSIVGDRKYPAKTFGKGMELLLGSQPNRGRRILKLAAGSYPPALTGSFGTPGIFSWGQKSLGLDSVPVEISGALTDELGSLAIVAGAGTNAITANVPTPVLLNQYRNYFLYSDDGNAIAAIVKNTANGGAGNVVFTIQTNNTSGGDFKIGKPAATVVLPDGGEYRFNNMQLGILNVAFTCALGASLVFEDCEVSTQSMTANLPASAELHMVRSVWTAHPARSYEEWDGIVNPTNPFSASQAASAALVLDSNSTGDIFIDDASEIHGYLVMQNAAIFVEAGARTDLLGPYLAPNVALDASGKALLGARRAVDLTRGIIEASSFTVDDSELNISNCDIGEAAAGNGTIFAAFSKLTLFTVHTLAGRTPTGTAFSLQQSSKCRLNAGTTMIGTGGVAKVETQTVANYAAITANADAPANAGMFVGTIQAACPQNGLANGCIIEIVP